MKRKEKREKQEMEEKEMEKKRKLGAPVAGAQVMPTRKKPRQASLVPSAAAVMVCDIS